MRTVVNCATFCRNKVACIAVCLAACRRFIDEVIGVLETSGINIWKQFQSCKLDDIEIPANNQGKKVFLRMALKRMKDEKQSEHS